MPSLCFLLMLAAATRPTFDDSTTRGLVAHGQFLASESDHAGAIAKYDAALKMEPGSAAAHAWKGASLISLNQLEEAQNEIGIALKSDSTDFSFPMIAGRLEVVRGNPEKARLLYQQAAQMSPRNAGLIWADLASVLAARKDSGLDAQIETALKLSATADPPHVDSLFALAQSYTSANRPEARATLRRYLDVTSKLPESQRNARQIQLAKQMLRALDILENR